MIKVVKNYIKYSPFIMVTSENKTVRMTEMNKK